MNRRIWPIEEKQAIVPERMKAAESMAALRTLHRLTASQDFAGASNSWLEDALASLSPQQKAILADLLAKVRASLLPRFTRDAAINVSASYETSDLPRLISRLGNYAPAPASAPNRPSAVSRRTAGSRPRPTRARTTTRRPQKGVSY